MSTNAVIFCKNATGTFDGISVHFDGYVDGGVGEWLFNSWKNTDEIRKLCAMKRQIRCFDEKFENIEFFTDYNEPLCRKHINELKNLTFEKMMNKCGNYNYAYFWDVQDEKGNYDWMLWKGNYTFKPVAKVLEDCRKEN